jgi:hypothetical protein
MFAAIAASSLAQTPEQESDSQYRETYAIVGARIEVGGGKVIEKGNVLVRNGHIQAVGTNVAVPDYAYVVKGDGLTVYPGFIDAYTTKGLKLPDPTPDQDVKIDTGVTAPVSMREANRKGIRPELNAADFLDLSGMDGERKAGITCELIAPSGGLLNGMGTFVNTSGRPPRESILLPAFGMSMGFQDPGQGYPATPLGFMALIRQTFLDAQRAALPSVAGDLPLADRPLLALQPVLKGQVPVFMECDRNFEIARCLGLADQFKFKPVIVGGLDASSQIAEIKKRNIPVILALNFAVEPSPKAAEKPATPVTPGAPSPPTQTPDQGFNRTEDADVIPAEMLAEQEGKWLDRVHSAKVLSGQVPFAFSSRGSKDRDEFWKNLRRVIAEGLDRQAALDALTINPAKLFGVDHDLGTVEAGKIANLTIMNGDFAKDGTTAKYVVVAGRLFDLTKNAAAPPPGRRRRGFTDDGHDNDGIGEGGR